MILLRVIGRVVDALTPWPPRHQRKAAIARARAEKENSRQAAAYADTIRSDLGELASRNHFAAAITAQIIARHQRGGGAA